MGVYLMVHLLQIISYRFALVSIKYKVFPQMFGRLFVLSISIFTEDNCEGIPVYCCRLDLNYVTVVFVFLPIYKHDKYADITECKPAFLIACYELVSSINTHQIFCYFK